MEITALLSMYRNNCCDRKFIIAKVLQLGSYEIDFFIVGKQYGTRVTLAL